jgi:hypothetical protein
MRILSTRAAFWVLVIAALVIAIVGVNTEAEAQVYTGTLTFQGLLPANITIVVIPGAGARYSTSFLGRPFDTGALSATVAGSSVTGVLISDRFLPCVFAGTMSGPTATLNLDPGTCGGPGLLVVTRAG